MNLLLDELLRRVARDPDFREEARRAPADAADRAGVPLAGLTAVLDGDLVTLHDLGAHPLLIMHLAAALGIDPMDRFAHAVPIVDGAIAAAADRLRQAEETRTPCPPVRDVLPMEVAAGYAVQRVLTGRRLTAGRRVVGRKIGLTNPKVQAQLGVDQPDFGVLFDDMAVPHGSTVDVARLLQPRIETEVAMVLGEDLDGPDLEPGRLRGAVTEVVAALEIVDSRVAGWDISIVDTVADNASSGLFVLGSSPVPLGGRDLRTVAMSMAEDGVEVSEGTGADCLGDPLAALAWLATTARDLGDPLRAGDVVLSGALGPMVPVRPGATYTAEVTGLGPVGVTFTARGAP